MDKRKRLDISVVDKLALARAVADGKVPSNVIQALVGNIRLLVESGMKKVPGCAIRSE